MIERIIAKWRNCDGCVLARTGRRNVVVGEGPTPCPLMLIGEGPGEDEDEQGRPFVGASGQFLHARAEQVGVELASAAFITNIVACRPPENRVPMPDEIQACRSRLESLVAAVQPKAILLLGGTALTAITGKQGITRARGKWFSTEWAWKGRRTVIPTLATFHPAGLLPGRLREPADLGWFGRDIRAAYDAAYGAP